MRSGRLVTVYTVVADTAAAGPAADGTQVFRFRTEAEAIRFAATSTTYGRPAKVTTDSVSRDLARRWGMA